MSTLTNVCRVQEETKEVTSVEEGYDVERVVEDDMVKLARELGAADSIHRQSNGRFQLYVENGNFYCHERPVCY